MGEYREKWVLCLPYDSACFSVLQKGRPMSGVGRSRMQVGREGGRE